MIPQKKINNEIWLVKKTRSPSHWQLSGSCLPMLCSDIYIFLNKHHGPTKKEWSTNQKWKLATGIIQSENLSFMICHPSSSWLVSAPKFALQCERPPGIEISRERTSNAATNTTFNVALLFGTLRQHARSNYIIATNGISWKTLRFGAKRHLPIWSLKFKKSLNLF